jgi:hypothetical protein
VFSKHSNEPAGIPKSTNISTIINVRGDIKYKFVCKRCDSNISRHIFGIKLISFRNPSKFLLRGRYEDSTKNLLDHQRNCNPADTPESKQITAFANGVKYSDACFRYLLAMWCACRHRPFNIVMNKELMEIFTMLYAHVKVPHPITVS